jgi:protein-tyrosine-phosphatase
LFISLVDDRGERQEWLVDSAGTWAVDGQLIANGSRLVLKEKGIDLSGHLSKVVTSDLINQFNLILTMEKGHKEALRLEFPEGENRIFMLSEMIGINQDVYDPMGGTLQEFEEVAELIESWMVNGYERIKELATGSGK